MNIDSLAFAGTNTSPLGTWRKKNHAFNHRRMMISTESMLLYHNTLSSSPDELLTSARRKPRKDTMVVTTTPSKSPKSRFVSSPHGKENATSLYTALDTTTTARRLKTPTKNKAKDHQEEDPQTPILFWSRKRELARRRRRESAAKVEAPRFFPSPQDQKPRAIQQDLQQQQQQQLWDSSHDEQDDDHASFLSSVVAEEDGLQDDAEDAAPSPPRVAIAHARLDSSLECCSCRASHSLYLMYPIIKTLDTWNESSKFLCSLCFEDDSTTNNTSRGDPTTDQEEQDASAGAADEDEDENEDTSKIHSLHPHQYEDRQQESSSENAIVRRSVRRQAQITTSLIREMTCDVQACLDLLHVVEDEMELAAISLSEDFRTDLEASIRREVSPPHCSRGRGSTTTSTKDLAALEKVETTIAEELKLHDALWQTHWDLLMDTTTVLQEALESEGDLECDLLLAYYQWRAGHRLPQGEVNLPPAWKVQADESLNQRDIKAGFGPGYFWGASGSAKTNKRQHSQVEETSSDDDEDEDPYRDHYVEELASIKESHVYRLFPTRRGLGWNAVQGAQHRLDTSHEEAEKEAYEEEAHMDCIVQTDNNDRDLIQQECKTELRTLLVRVHDDPNVLRPQLMSPPQKLNKGHVPPPLPPPTKKQNLNKGHVPPLPPQTKNKQRASSWKRNEPPAMTSPETKSSASSVASEEEYRPARVAKKSSASSSARVAKKSPARVAKKSPASSSPAAKFPSPPRKRAKRRCLRCFEFGGSSPTRCRGSKGRWGQKGCEYFNAKGKKLKRSG